MLAYQAPAATTKDEVTLGVLIDDVRTVMEGEMDDVRRRCQTYLNWYSPPFDPALSRHDAWETPIDPDLDAERTRDNFPICRAVVDIWTSLEAARPPTPRAEPERVPFPPPDTDQGRAAVEREMYQLARTVSSRKADLRSAIVRNWLRRDHFPLKHHKAVRRKNLYGFSWMKVIPDPYEQRPRSHVMRNPTTVYPIWSRRDPEDMEAVLSVQQESAIRADEKYGLGLAFETDRQGRRTGRILFDRGHDTGRYQEINDRWFDSSRTMVWVEDFWWIERDYEDMHQTGATVHNAIRVCDRIVHYRAYPWRHLPWVYWENTDERDSFGWSDIAGVIDINDEFNRRLSEEGDILGMYAEPRFQLLGSVVGRQVELPAPLELIALQDTERIEQILTRIDVYPQQVHLQALTDLLHRVSGLPPIVWGLISNAQTSGRALTASWKATETRLSPKLMRNEQSLDGYLDIALGYARAYDWGGARRAFEANDGRPYDDFRWTFPPMEPRDFQEVTMDAITRRDAGLTTTVKAMRDTGDEAAEDTWEEVQAENLNIHAHPDKVQSYLLAVRAQLDNIQMAMQLGQAMQGPVNTATVAQAVGQARSATMGQPAASPPGVEGALPPTAPGAAGNAGQPGAPPGTPAPAAPGASTLTSGTLVRGGDVSNQFLETRRY